MKQQNELQALLRKLKPILPNRYDRFGSQCTQDAQGRNNTSAIQPRIQIERTKSELYDRSVDQGKLIHPEGGLVYSQKRLVSDSPISTSLRSIGDEILSRCSKLGFFDVTVFLRRRGSALEYYIAAHPNETIVWMDNHRPEGLLSCAASRIKNMLAEEYWAHMEAIPGSHHINVNSITRLRNVLSSLAIDSATSDGSTSPFTCNQIGEFLQHLNSFDDTNIDVYQTYAVARIWNMIWHARVINNYGSSDACLDRFIALSNNPPTFTALNKLWALATQGAAERNLNRCSRAWAGRTAYVGEWRQFKAQNETEWQQVTKLASAMVIASLLLLNVCKLKLPVLLSTMLSLSAAAHGHHLSTESQNLGDHASDASSYFQKWEKPDYNVQRIALRNATPQALLGWAFIAFFGSVACVL